MVTELGDWKKMNPHKKVKAKGKKEKAKKPPNVQHKFNSAQGWQYQVLLELGLERRTV